MATTYPGKNLRVRIGGKTIFHATECSFSSTRTMDAMVSKDTNGEQSSPGSYTWGISTSFLMANAPAAAATQIGTKELLDLYQAGTEVEIQFSTNIVGDVIISGAAFIEVINLTAPTTGASTGDSSFKGNNDFITENVA